MAGFEDLTLKDMANGYVEAKKTEFTLLAPVPTAIAVFGSNMAKGKTIKESADAVGDHFQSTTQKVKNVTKNTVHKAAEKFEQQPTPIKAMFGVLPWAIQGLDSLIN